MILFIRKNVDNKYKYEREGFNKKKYYLWTQTRRGGGEVAGVHLNIKLLVLSMLTLRQGSRSGDILSMVCEGRRSMSTFDIKHIYYIL